MKNNFFWIWNPLFFEYFELRKCKISCNNKHHLCFNEGFESLIMFMIKNVELISRISAGVTTTTTLLKPTAGLRLHIVPTITISAAWTIPYHIPILPTISSKLDWELMMSRGRKM